MRPTKSPLKEVANGSQAIKSARSEPIQQEQQPRQSMDFLRSLVLDIPVQHMIERPVSEGLNLEKMLETRLEYEARKSEDPQDHISFDVPLLIRVFELVREGINSDIELHKVVERLIALKNKGVLTMDDYDAIAGGNPNGEAEPKSKAAQEPQLPKTDTNLDQIKKLAGL